MPYLDRILEASIDEDNPQLVYTRLGFLFNDYRFLHGCYDSFLKSTYWSKLTLKNAYTALTAWQEKHPVPSRPERRFEGDKNQGAAYYKKGHPVPTSCISLEDFLLIYYDVSVKDDFMDENYTTTLTDVSNIIPYRIGPWTADDFEYFGRCLSTNNVDLIIRAIETIERVYDFIPFVIHLRDGQYPKYEYFCKLEAPAFPDFIYEALRKLVLSTDDGADVLAGKIERILFGLAEHGYRREEYVDWLISIEPNQNEDLHEYVAARLASAYRYSYRRNDIGARLTKLIQRPVKHNVSYPRFVMSGVAYWFDDIAYAKFYRLAYRIDPLSLQSKGSFGIFDRRKKVVSINGQEVEHLQPGFDGNYAFDLY